MALTYPPFAAVAGIVAAASNKPPLRRSARGIAVAVLQGGMIDFGLKLPKSTSKSGHPDGIYGEETSAAIRGFQSSQGLSSDGVAGRNTVRRLDALLASALPTAAPAPAAPPPPPVLDRHYQMGRADPSIKPDAGAGAFNSKAATASMWALKQAIAQTLPPIGFSASTFIGPDAARHMRHYLNASGHTYAIRLEKMIDDVPSAKQRFLAEVRQAQRFVEKLPEGDHRITSRTAESAYNRKQESYNWFFAIGGYSTWGKGVARVTGTGPGAACELDFEYGFFDRYNWDNGKKVDIAGIEITDEFMGEFHRQGLAREFDCRASITRQFRWARGTAIPPEQLEPAGGRSG